MKRFLTIFVFALCVIGIHAQTPGQVGTLLPNTAPQAKNTTKNYNYGNQNYYWNYNYVGYSEVFIRIPENGSFTVSINNQSITTNTGRFRFFDLQPGYANYITILRNGYVVYKANLNLQNNTRYIIDYFTYQGMYLLNTVPLNMPQGGGNYSDMWNQMWNGLYNGNGYNFNYGQNWNPFFGLNYNNFNPNPNQPVFPNQPNYPNYPNQPNNPNWGGGQVGNGFYVMDGNTFNQFKNSVRSQSFDNGKTSVIKNQTKTNWFTAAQIKELCDLFSFDSGKLEIAKYLYDYCADKQNYFQVYPTFDFDSNVKELTKYISGK